jgi:hypothetical protein
MSVYTCGFSAASFIISFTYLFSFLK